MRQTDELGVVCRYSDTCALTADLFLLRDAMLARYMPYNRVTNTRLVCLSVCLSQVGVLLKRLNVGSCKQRHMIAHAEDLSKTQTASPQMEAPDVCRVC